MAQSIPLTTRMGEVMAPGVLVTSLMLAPDGTLTLDPAALHGRSALESQVTEWVRQRQQVGQGRRYWVIWVAIELDAEQRPARYVGLSLAELIVDLQRRMGYKSVAVYVNRMTEAMQGRVSLEPLSFLERQRLREELIRLDPEVWERSESRVKDALVALTP